MPSFSIRYSSVVRFIPSRATAPVAPPTMPLASRNASRMASRSTSSSVRVVAAPGLANLDVGLSRRFAVGDPLGFTFDGQAFNLLNTTHFDLPERFADEPSTFVRIFSAKAPRQVQATLRLSF